MNIKLIKSFNPEKVPAVIAELSKRTLTMHEIAEILEIDNTPNSNYSNRVVKAMETLASEGYPIYCPTRLTYRLLTKDILDEYEEKHRTTLKDLYKEYCNGEYL